MTELDHPSVDRPTPVPFEGTQRFWEEASAGRLTLQRCEAGHVQFYPRRHCRFCGETELSELTASGEGTVHTFSVVYRAAHDGFVARVPYVFAIVDLPEGPRVTANIVDIDPESVHVGMRVEATFDDVVGELTLPQFKPASTGSGSNNSHLA